MPLATLFSAYLGTLSSSNHSCQCLYLGSNNEKPCSNIKTGKLLKICIVEILDYLKNVGIRNITAYVLGTSSLQKQLIKYNFIKAGCLEKYLLCVDDDIASDKERDAYIFYKNLR